MPAPRKPTGELGFIRVHGSRAGEYHRLLLPDGKEEIENCILEHTVEAARRRAMPLFGGEGPAVRNLAARGESLHHRGGGEGHGRLDSVSWRWASGSDDRARCGSRRASYRRALGTLSMGG